MAFELNMNAKLSSAIDAMQSDRERGLKTLRKLAKTGDASALVYLGLYLSEDSASTEEAEYWLRRGAELKSPDAAWNLAIIEKERGDVSAMRRWIDCAAEYGELDAIRVRSDGYNLGGFIASLSQT